MRIGELAKQTRVSVRSLRHYDEMGLLESRRQANGYREFDEGAVNRVRKIRALIKNGFNVEDIRPMVPCLDSPSGVENICHEAIALYQSKLSEVKTRIRELEDVRKRIEQRIAHMRKHQAKEGKFHAESIE